MFSHKRTGTGTFICIALFMVVVFSTVAEDAKKDPNADLKAKLEKLQLEQQIADAEKAIAADKRASLDSNIPKSTTTPLQGTVTIDDSVLIEATTLAYKASNDIAREIGIEITQRVRSGPKLTKLIIYNEDDVKLLPLYQSFSVEVDLIDQQYNSIIARASNKEALPPRIGAKNFALPAALGPALETGTGTIKAMLDLIALFRTDTIIKGKTITLEDQAVIAEVARFFQDQPNCGVSIKYPRLVPMMDQTNVQRRIAELKAKRSQAVSEVAKSTKKDELTSQLTSTNDTLDSFVNMLEKVDEKTLLTPLSNLMRVEALYTELQEPGAYLLQVKICAAGGNNKTTNNLFLGSKLYHDGGAVCSYFLFDKDGAIALSGMLYEDGDYVKAEKIGKNFPR